MATKHPATRKQQNARDTNNDRWVTMQWVAVAVGIAVLFGIGIYVTSGSDPAPGHGRPAPTVEQPYEVGAA